MRAKKFLALLLSGMVLAGCLSGCNRTIIEHQFHTNTVTDIVTDTVTDTVMVLPGFYKLHSLFISNGVNVDLDCAFTGVGTALGPYEDSKELIDQWINSPLSDEEMKKFYEKTQGDYDYLVKMIEITGDYTSALSELAGKVYDELTAYMESSDWNWDYFKNEGAGVYIVAQLQYAELEDGGQKYFFCMALKHRDY